MPRNVRIAKWMIARAQRVAGRARRRRGDPARARSPSIDEARRDRRLRVRGARRDRARARRRRRPRSRGRRRRTPRSRTTRDSRRTSARGSRGSPRSPPATRRRRSHESAEAPRDLRALARRQSASDVRARAPDAVRAAGRRRALGAGDRQGRQQGDGEALSRRQHAGGDRRSSASRDSFPTCSRSASFATRRRTSSRCRRSCCASTAARCPRDREALEKLPGVGRKTANVVLNVAFGEPTIAVDTHIFRVANRTGLAPGKTPEEVEQKLLKFVPDEFKPHAHHWLILHGRYVCVARSPKCPRVPDPRSLRIPAEDEVARSQPIAATKKRPRALLDSLLGGIGQYFAASTAGCDAKYAARFSMSSFDSAAANPAMIGFLRAPDL